MKRTKTLLRVRLGPGRCASRGCRNKRAKKSDGYFLQHCWKCRSRKFKKSQPITYVLNMLRHSARKRGLSFSLTKAEFARWCEETHYLEERGRNSHSMTVDRIDPNEGYHIWNIRPLSFEENSQQGRDNRSRQDRLCECPF